MPVTAMQKKSIIKDRLFYLKNSIANKMSDSIGLNVDYLDDLDLLVSELEKDSFMNFSQSSYRFNRVYALFANTSRDLDHYMSKISKENNNMEIPITELYDNDNFKLLFQDVEYVDLINNYRMLSYKPEKYSLVYFECSDVSLTKKMMATHPFALANTLHELFKILFEWEWASYELSSSEPMALVCKEVLSDFGISYQHLKKPEVQAINSMPDTHLARFIKQQEFLINENDPEQPMEFKLWACNKGFLNFYNELYSVIYKQAVQIITLEKELAKI